MELHISNQKTIGLYVSFPFQGAFSSLELHICYEKKGVTVRINRNFYSDGFEIIRNGKYANIVTNEKLKISYNRITEEIKFCDFDEDENIELMNMFLLNETDAKVMLVKTDGGIIPYTA